MNVAGIQVANIGGKRLQDVKRRDRMLPVNPTAVMSTLVGHATGARAR